MKKYVFLLFIFFFTLESLIAQNILSGHRGKITSIIHNGDTIISAGEDGFIVFWNAKEKKSSERFQLTSYSIHAMVKHPSKDEICIVEAAGIDDYRLSVWNYKFKKKYFTLHSDEPIAFLNYTAGGSIIITTGFNGSQLALFDSTLGTIIRTPNIPQGSVSLSITGKTERNILIYQTDTENEGQLLYYDLQSGEAVTGSFPTLNNLLNPIVFGNGRFLAGTSSGGLFVIDAVTGNEITNLRNIEKGALLCPAGDDFYCLGGKGEKSKLYRFSIGRNGRLTTKDEINLSIKSEDQASALAYNFQNRTGDSVAFASANDGMFILEQNRNAAAMAHNFQTRTSDIAASSSNIAVLSENNGLFFIPLDYTLLEDNESLRLEKKEGYTNITAVNKQESFILWQKTNTKYIPQIVYSDNKNIGTDANLKFMLGRYPLRTISSAYNRILVLDSSGHLSVFNADALSASAQSKSLSPVLGLSSIGAVDAVFPNSENVLLCMSSVIRGSNPFFFSNIKTSETVPVSYPAAITGLTAYSGNSGNIYAAAVEMADKEIKTTVLQIGTPAGRVVPTQKIFEYSGEDANISIAESGSRLAISCGSEGAAICGERTIYFDRTDGLPVKLLGSEKYFLCMDSEGSISWHDNKTGKLLAIFKFFEDRWILTSDKEISGSFTP